MVNLLKFFKGKKKFYVSASVFLIAFLVMGALAAYWNSDQGANAAAQASKVLIIGNDDTYYGSTINGGSSADNMKAALVANGFDTSAVTVWKESAKGGVPPSLATLNTYDLVIFSQGVGYRNINNGKEGLNLNDLNLLKQYMNITSSGNKARLLIEGEDVMSDIIRVGTSTDQRDLLKIATASSADNYGRITRLNITNTSHDIFNYPFDITAYPNANTTYQQSFQDYIAPNQTVGARTIASANFSGRSGAYSVMNTWEDSAGHREVFTPFAWRVDGTTSNTISDYLVNGKQWRDQLLVNMATWVGERKVNVTSTDISNSSASRGETSGMLALTLSPTMLDTTVTPPNLSSLKINLGGTIDPTKVTAKLYKDDNNGGTIGVLDGTDTEIGTASFSGGVATLPANLEVTSTKYLLVAYQFAADAADNSTADVSLDADAFTVNSLDRLTRVYGTSGVHTNPTTVKIGGTAVLKTPVIGSTVGQNVTFTGTTSTGYTLSYTSGYNNTAGPWTQFATGAGAISSSTLGVWNTSAGSPPDGAYTVKLEVSSGSIDYVSLYLDNTAPAITDGPTLAALRDISATVNWTTDESSTSQVVYRVSPAGAWQYATSTTKVQQHSLTLNQLTPNTSYEYQVVSADGVGNQVTSAVKTFSTYDLGPFADITSPAPVGGVAPRVSDAVPIEGSAYTNQSGHSVVWTVYYGKGFSEDEITDWNEISSGSNSIHDGLLATWNAPLTDGAYVLWLAVRDPALSGVTAEYDVYLPVVVDNSKPQISDAQAVHITNSTANITWNTSKMTVDEISYGSEPGILSFTIPDTDKDKDIFLYDLQPGTKYYFHVTATDNGGHVTETPELTFTTTNNTEDSNPPIVSSVSMAAAGRTSSEIDLKWNAAYDESGISGYKIFRSPDGTSWTLIGGSSGHSLTFADTGLVANHLYYYALTAVDPYGNESDRTTPIQVLTMAGERINPHGAYTKLTVMCSKCHTVHRGKKEFLFNRTQEATMCYTCHDASGTGSRFAIEAEYDPSHLSRHPLPMNHTNKECASCHNPHLNPRQYPRLLQSVNTVTGQVYHGGNGFCYNCHGVNGPDRVLDNTAGAHDVFELSVHNLGAKMPSPASGTGIKCANCHANHASDHNRLTLAKEEENCYLCHGDNADKLGIRNAKQDITKTSFHNVDGNPTVGNVECVNCHNPHYVQSKELNTSDPFETNVIWPDDSTHDRTKFCLTCHGEQHYDSNGNPHLDTPRKHVSRTENVPYTVYFPLNPFVPTTIGSTTGNLKGWDKSGFIAGGSIHYNNGTKAVQCTACHSPHGSAYQRMVRREEDSYRSSTDGSCSICHSGSATGVGVWRAVYGGDSIPDIYSELEKTFAHPVLGTDSTYLHNDTEDYSTTALDHKHAECQDCHDPHQARKSKTKVGELSGPLYNVRGVMRSPVSSNYDPAASLVYTDGPATQDWQICYKCHSNYWDKIADGTSGMRNIAAEFYRSNTAGTYGSFHFVELTSNAHTANTGTGTTNHFNLRFTADSVDHDGNPWTGSSKMYCQDCHGDPTTGAANGPHGSPNQSMLKGSYYTFEEGNRSAMADDLICFRCHDKTIYRKVSGDYSTTLSSNGHAVSKSDHTAPCWFCHGSRAHGSSRNHLIEARNTGVNEWDPDYEANSGINGGGGSYSNDPNLSTKSSCRILSTATDTWSGANNCSDHF